MPSKKQNKLRHNARSLDQECRRDSEMREAVKAADQAVSEAWERRHLDMGEAQFRTLNWKLYDELQAAARAVARKDLREAWQREDAAWCTPLTSSLVRMTPAEVHEIKRDTTINAEYRVQTSDDTVCQQQSRRIAP